MKRGMWWRCPSFVRVTRLSDDLINLTLVREDSLRKDVCVGFANAVFDPHLESRPEEHYNRRL